MCECKHKPLTSEELAERWHTTPAALATRRSSGSDMPCGFKIGRRWFYHLTDIIAYENRGKDVG